MRINRKHYAGFTLTEILVVVGIIGLLSAVIFPVFTKVRESGRRTTCANNLQQIGMAIRHYVADAQEKYPPGTPFGPSLRCSWPDRLFSSYVKNADLFYCPSHPSPKQTYQPLSVCNAAGTSSIDEDEAEARYDGSYDYVYYSSVVAPLKQFRLRNPGQTVLILDGTGALVNTGRDTTRTMEEIRKDDAIRPWHRQGNNNLFADGHVKWMAFDSIYQREYWIP